MTLIDLLKAEVARSDFRKHERLELLNRLKVAGQEDELELQMNAISLDLENLATKVCGELQRGGDDANN
jgi:hypothetical protein